MNRTRKTMDLRSDTVTLPTPAMFDAMCNAQLGDDVLGDDPTVVKLEHLGAEMMKKDAASLPGFNLSSDITPTLEKSVDDVVSPAITMTTEGVIGIPDTPGLGFKVLPEFIKAYQVR